MSFKDTVNNPIVREMEKDYRRAIAQKIRNRLQQLENANEKDKRRWIWELLQNANDTVTDGRKVDIRITVTEQGIEFSHNGDYFSPRNITNLVHQISSKEGEDNIGRFGTGFLTTHTLSRIIEISGIYTEKEKYTKFQMTLDRTGSTEKELVSCLEKTWDTLEEIVLERKPQEIIWTKLKYLNHDKTVAEDTIIDFKTFIHYNLAFVPSIGSITVDNKLTNSYFSIKETSKETINEVLSIISFEEINNTHKTERKILLADDSKIQAALEITSTNTAAYSISRIKKNIPRIFCAFPLIGTEKFHFPMVLNSRNFMPKTERDGLYLKGETAQTEKNKPLLIAALSLFTSTLEYLSILKTEKLYLLAEQKEAFKDDYFDIDWYQEFIQKPIQDRLLDSPIVKTETGTFEKIKTIKFPYHSRDKQLDSKITKELWKFQSALYPSLIPQESDIENWTNVLWEGCTKVSLASFANNIQKFEFMDSLAKELKENLPEKEVFEWLNEVILFYIKNGYYLLNQYKICPNQEKAGQGRFCLKNELYVDSLIQEELKDIYEIFTEIKPWRKELLSQKIPALEKKLKEEKKIRYSINIIQGISAKIEQEQTNQEQVRKAVFSLISLMPKGQSSTDYKKNREYRIDVYRFNSNFFKEDVPTVKLVADLPIKTWEVADKWAFNLLTATIEELGSTKKLSEKLNLENKEIAADWLNELFIFFIKEDKKAPLSRKIYPNQLGLFSHKYSLYQDGNIAEEFKDILEELDKLVDTEVKGWRSILLEERITAFKEKEKLPTKTTQDISDAINKIITTISHGNFEVFRVVIFKLAAFINAENRHQRKLWEYLRTFYLEEVPQQLQPVKNAINFDWQACFLCCVEMLITDISKLEKTAVLKNKLHGDVEVIDWLNDFLDFIHESDSYKHLLDGDIYAVIPNQNGGFQYKNRLWLDNEIDQDLKEIISLLNKPWLDTILDDNIYLELPPDRTKTTIEAAIEVDSIFRTYTDDTQRSEYVQSFRLISKWLTKADPLFIQKNMSWVFNNKTELALSLLGTDKEKDEIFQIIESGKAPLLSKIAKQEDFTIEDLEKLIENPEQTKILISQLGNNSHSRWSEAKSFEEEIQERTGNSANSLEELITKYNILKEKNKKEEEEEQQREPKFSFRREGKSSWSTVNFEAVRISNETARESIYQHLKSLNDYDVTSWTKESNTIIKNVKKHGITIGLVTKGADNKIIYINSAEQELLSDTKNFSELWVHSNGKIYQITLGQILKIWNVQSIKIDMFDFSNKS